MDLIVATNNNVETKKNSFGVCISMCTYWVKASQRYGGVTKTWQIGQTGSFRIRQAAGMIGSHKGDRNIIKNAGLSVTGEYAPENYTQINTGLTWAGYHIVTLWNNAWTSGHAMASWNNNGKLQFFDPNFGLYNVASTAAMLNDVYNHCATTYPDLQSHCILYNVI
ncbi:MAG TPA: hypothetical protein ENN05_11185 [Deltaproteobacteria bacterium]|nr:hypothetical protein [Deltaproteobacteria bacterium]